MIQIVKFNSKVYAVVPDKLRVAQGCDVCAFKNDQAHMCRYEKWPDESAPVINCVDGEHHYEEVETDVAR
jgi:hypothetical protein